MKNAVFWDVTPCPTCKNLPFGADSCHPDDGGDTILRDVGCYKSHTA
jgi:hypothetical protein